MDSRSITNGLQAKTVRNGSRVRLGVHEFSNNSLDVCANVSEIILLADLTVLNDRVLLRCRGMINGDIRDLKGHKTQE